MSAVHTGGSPEAGKSPIAPNSKSTPREGIEVIREDENPDTVAITLSRAIAGAAIEDHFLDVVLPTVSRAIKAQRDRLLADTEKAVNERLTGDVRNVVMPILKDVVDEAIQKQRAFEPGVSVEIIDHARDRIRYLSRQHHMFPILVRLLCILDRNGNPLNVALNGPAGNGKTSMALAAGDALGIARVLQPFNPQTTKSDLLGYMDASGRYIPSPFYDAFKHGKLYIADEFDAANPSVAVTLNAAVANRILTFPNLETVEAHPNFRAVFIMNTLGTGADHQYTGRFRQDAATLDRLVQLNTPIDPALEASIAGHTKEASQIVDIEEGGKFRDNAEILKMVRAVRSAVEALKMKYIISPRATLHSTAMHAGGFGKKWIMDCCIWRGMPEADREAIAQRAGLAL